MKIEVGKSYLTRKGYVVEITHKAKHITSFPFNGEIDLGDGDKCPVCYTIYGHFFPRKGEHALDLVKEFENQILIGD